MLSCLYFPTHHKVLWSMLTVNLYGTCIRNFHGGCLTCPLSVWTTTIISVWTMLVTKDRSRRLRHRVRSNCSKSSFVSFSLTHSYSQQTWHNVVDVIHYTDVLISITFRFKSSNGNHNVRFYLTNNKDKYDRKLKSSYIPVFYEISYETSRAEGKTSS